jgi:hypothetical protein
MATASVSFFFSKITLNMIFLQRTRAGRQNGGQKRVNGFCLEVHQGRLSFVGDSQHYLDSTS